MAIVNVMIGGIERYKMSTVTRVCSWVLEFQQCLCLFAEWCDEENISKDQHCMTHANWLMVEIDNLIQIGLRLILVTLQYYVPKWNGRNEMDCSKILHIVSFFMHYTTLLTLANF